MTVVLITEAGDMSERGSVVLLTDNPRRNRQVAKVKIALPEFVMVDVKSINNLKDWSIASYLLVLIGGILVGGVFLFFQPGIDIALPLVCIITGVIMIIVGVLVEARKFGNFMNGIRHSGIDAGYVYYSGDTSPTEEDYKQSEETQNT